MVYWVYCCKFSIYIRNKTIYFDKKSKTYEHFDY